MKAVWAVDHIGYIDHCVNLVAIARTKKKACALAEAFKQKHGDTGDLEVYRMPIDALSGFVLKIRCKPRLIISTTPFLKIKSKLQRGWHKW